MQAISLYCSAAQHQIVHLDGKNLAYFTLLQNLMGLNLNF